MQFVPTDISPAYTVTLERALSSEKVMLEGMVFQGNANNSAREAMKADEPAPAGTRFVDDTISFPKDKIAKAAPPRSSVTEEVRFEGEPGYQKPKPGNKKGFFDRMLGR